MFSIIVLQVIKIITKIFFGYRDSLSAKPGFRKLKFKDRHMKVLIEEKQKNFSKQRKNILIQYFKDNTTAFNNKKKKNLK